MKIRDCFCQNRSVFSFEVYPPKKDESMENTISLLQNLSRLKPDFICVAYGAGGAAADTYAPTCNIAAKIKKQYHIEAMPHLSCINSTKNEINQTLQLLQNNGIENILALRGDRSHHLPQRDDFHYAYELVGYIREHHDFYMAGACYPEIHPEAESMQSDIEHLKIKVDAGVSHLISQICFDNDKFLSFQEKVKAAGIHIPMEAGIMAVSSKKQLENMVKMCGISVPPKLKEIVLRYENDEASLREAGITYAIEQIKGLLDHGVDGIHLFTMNDSYTATQVCKPFLSAKS